MLPRSLNVIHHALFASGRRYISRAVGGFAALVLLAAVPTLLQAQCIQSGNDWTCSGNVGTTTVTGSSAVNLFQFLNGVTGQITLISNGGHDTIDMSTFTSDITMNLSNTSSLQTVVTGLQILFQDFNTSGDVFYINLGSGNDTFTGGAADDVPNGAAGVDTLSTGAGNDYLIGGPGNDILSGGTGGDQINADDGDDTLNGGDNGDALNGGSGNDIINGGSGNDSLGGDLGDDTLSGGPGTDNLMGSDGTDTSVDTIESECSGDTLSNVEINNCGTEEEEEPEPEPEPEVEVKIEVPAPHAAQMCVTQSSQMDLTDRNMIVIYSDYTNTPNGMIITEIPLASVRAVTDDEKASNAWVPLVYKDSEFAPGWSVGLYWHENHYGAIIYKEYGKIVVDDTGAICGWF